MWAVQTFEYYLACLSILRAPAKNADRLIDTPQKSLPGTSSASLYTTTATAAPTPGSAQVCSG
jgi:hypothetical protein